MLRTLRRSAARISASLRYLIEKKSSGRWSEMRMHTGLDYNLAYRLYVPAGADHDTLPLLVMLHGCKQDAQSFAAGTRMNELADRHRFIVLYPEQSRAANPLLCWNWFNVGIAQGRDEAAMIAHLIVEICDSHAIDRRRVYVAGMSAGAAMTRILCVRYARLFAAAVIHSGLMYRAASSIVDALSVMRHGSHASPEATAHDAMLIMDKHTYIVPTLLIHGDQDDVVNPINMQQHVEQLIAMTSLCDQPCKAGAETLLTQGGRHYRMQDFNCDSHLLLRRCLIEGLGHAWSGGDAHYPFNDSVGPSSSELAWNFLAGFRHTPESGTVVIQPWHSRIRAQVKQRLGY